MATIPNWLKAPDPLQNVSMGMVTHTNPLTGETFTAPSGGYTLNLPTSTAPAPMLTGLGTQVPGSQMMVQPGGGSAINNFNGVSTPIDSLGNPIPTAAAPVANQSNFNFNPSGIDSSGSYNTSDWASLLGGAYTGGVAGAAAGAGVNEAIARLQALGQAGVTDYTNLARTATQGIDFKPYTLTSALGTTQQTAPGVISQELTPQQQANVTAAQRMQGSLYGAALPDTSGIAQGAFTGAQAGVAGVGTGQEDLAALRAGYGTAAQGMTGMLGGSTTGMANQLFQQQQAMRTPEQQRQQLELENRLRAQGRLGTSTAAYGGTPEQLAMAKAMQEQQAADAFNSMTQAEQMATSQQARALGLGNATSSLAQAQQALRQGDINAAQGLFSLGSSAAQLPQQMRGQDIAQAGQLQQQALAPASQQLQQAQLAGQLGQQQAQSAYQAGGLFGNLAGAGLQERLTAESAAAATRTKQFDSILKSYAARGGKAGAAAGELQGLIERGLSIAGGMVYDGANKLLGPIANFVGEAATNLWSSIENSINTEYYTGGVNPYDLSWDSISEATGESTNIISDAWDWVTGLFD